jgi:hypothetical protein
MSSERDLESLFKQLGDHAHDAIRTAIYMAAGLKQRELCVNHWVLKLLEQDDNDFRRILSAYETNFDGLQIKLQEEINEYPKAYEKLQVIHEDVISLTQIALELATHTDSPVIRSGHLCCILTTHDSFAKWRARFHDFIAFESIQKSLTTRLHSLIEGSPEDKDVSDFVNKRSGMVFISYARSDFDFARQLAQELRLSGIGIWMDKLSIGIAEDWDAIIDRAIERCPIFLIILTPSSVASLEVRAELRSAVTQEKHIVPVMVKDCKLPRYLQMVNYIDFRGIQEEKAAALTDLVNELKAFKNKYNFS